MSINCVLSAHDPAAGMNVGWLSGRPDEWSGGWRQRSGGREPRGGGPRESSDSYNLWVNAPMTPTTAPTQSTVDLPAGLTVAESTRELYAHGWRVWERWCAARDVAPMPADPAMICAYLTERAGEGVTVGTLDLACSAIAYRHRRSELAELTLADVEAKPGGMLLTVRRSKTDQYAEDQIVAVAHGHHAHTDPVAASTRGSPSAAARRASCSPACATGRSLSSHSPATASPACSAPGPAQQDLPPSGSPPTPCAPNTSPSPQPSPASASTGSSPKPGTGACPLWSSATSVQRKRWR